MSDRTYAQVIVADCPEAQRAACREAIYDTFEADALNEEPMIDTDPGATGEASYRPSRWRRTTDLVLHERYGDDECALDMHDRIAAAIIEAAPGATFVVWVDPKYEYTGELVAYAPDLGRFDSSCDADGNPTVTAYDILRLPDPIDRAAIEARLGKAWMDRLAPAEPVPA